MSHCHYCRDAAITTAGGRDVCDDCCEAYERVVSERAAAAKKRLRKLDEESKCQN